MTSSHTRIKVALATSLFLSTVAHADAQSARPMLVAYASASITNLCVDYIVTRQLDDARSACNGAVREAKRARTEMSNWMTTSRKDFNEQIALAYSNRAVLHWLSDNSDAAAADLAKARRLSPEAAYVARNETALTGAPSKVAQVK